MRRSEGAWALIQRGDRGSTRILTRWNSRWQALHLVGGHRRPGESFRACLLREVGEELGLATEDFTAADQPLARLEYTAWSEGAREETEYLLEIFVVELTRAAVDHVSANPANAWLSTEEAYAGLATDGRRVSPTLPRALGQLPDSAK
jgi:8-oxo-dGTP pyrophosphatase MutT (NUDIX family)